MAQLTVPVVFDHDDLQRMVNEKIAEVKAQFIPKADYENRLKADMVAMLEDLDLRLEEMENPFSTRVSGCSKDGWEHGVKNSRFLVNEKINALKGDTE